MNFWELLPNIDCIAESTEEIRWWLRDHPTILKETSDYNRVTEFLDLHLSNSDKPVIGDTYYPVMITSQSFANSLLVVTGQSGKLVKIDDINKAYTFVIGNITKTLPEGARKMGDITQWGILYYTSANATQFLSLLKLSFGDWQINVKPL